MLLMICTPTFCYAQLSSIELSEAISVLGLDSESLAAAGVDEGDAESVWSAVQGDEDNWGEYQQLQLEIRNAIDGLDDAEDVEAMAASIQALRSDLAQHRASWRSEICSELSTLEVATIVQIAANSKMPVPVYIRVMEWDSAESTLIVRGYNEHKRNERMGRPSQPGEAIDAFLAALGESVVVQAKANHDVRAGLLGVAWVQFLIEN